MTVLAGAEPFSHDGGPIGVLLCHGFTGSPRSMRPWADYLAERGCTVRLPLLPGHGTRWQDLARTEWPDWYAADERAFDELRDRCSKVFIMGLSMGGTLALRIAEQRGTDVGGLVLVNPSLSTEDRRLAFVPVLKHLTASVAAIGNDIKKPGIDELAYTRTPLRAVDSLRHLWAVTAADLAKVTQPVLLYRSPDDHIVAPSSSRLLLARISSTDVSEVLCHDSFHVATLDNDAPAIFAGSAAFIDRLVPRAAAG